jgi:hypothetical protein
VGTHASSQKWSRSFASTWRNVTPPLESLAYRRENSHKLFILLFLRQQEFYLKDSICVQFEFSSNQIKTEKQIKLPNQLPHLKQNQDNSDCIMASRIVFGRKRSESQSRRKALVCTCPSEDNFKEIAKGESSNLKYDYGDSDLYTPRTIKRPSCGARATSGGFYKATTRANSHVSFSSDSDLEEPEGGLFPILLPNEMLLQQFSKSCLYRTSQWRLDQNKENCQLCTLASQVTERRLCENDHDELTKGNQHGTLYVTSERVIFVPDEPEQKGWSVMITKLEKTKVLTSTEQKTFFVAYIGNSICSIPFSTIKRAKSFLKLISNINLEHMIKQHLPPLYSSNWDEEYNKLPTYQDSESALRKYLTSKGAESVKELLRKETEPPRPTTPPVQAYPADYYYAASFVWF